MGVRVYLRSASIGQLITEFWAGFSMEIRPTAAWSPTGSAIGSNRSAARAKPHAKKRLEMSPSTKRLLVFITFETLPLDPISFDTADYRISSSRYPDQTGFQSRFAVDRDTAFHRSSARQIARYLQIVNKHSERHAFAKISP
jgi:hypothetical protein